MKLFCRHVSTASLGLVNLIPVLLLASVGLRDAPCICRFYDKAHKLDVLDFFKAQAVHPDAVPDAVFRCIGRTVWADIGEAPD